MSIAGNWRERHPREKGGPVRVFVLVLMLAVVVFMILNARSLARGFTALTTPPAEQE